MLSALHQLSTQALRTLASSLRDGRLSTGLNSYALKQISGSMAPDVQTCIADLQRSGMTSAHVAVLVDGIADARDGIPLPSSLFDLVLSGPDVRGIPTADTAAVIRTLVEQAISEVLLVGYAVFQGKRLFERLASRMEETEDLRVWLCLDIARKQGDTSASSEIVLRFARDFKNNHWPGKRLPELLYDPRSLSDSWDKRSSLHAKCVVVDRRVALITSANFTEAAQQRNIEAGVLVRYPLFVERLVGYFEGLRAAGQLACCPLR
jgi:phosphatidylserine/phosphatidylglycerophosphate/cardiolipin synthase-like enzyme